MCSCVKILDGELAETRYIETPDGVPLADGVQSTMHTDEVSFITGQYRIVVYCCVELVLMRLLCR